jgi:hypothetical protein
LLNGAGWALLQNWSWAKRIWPEARFNFWRCWESSGGINIGIAYFLVNRRIREPGRSLAQASTGSASPNLERFGAYLGLMLGLGLSIGCGLKGWANIYLGNENDWNAILWKVFGPLLILGFLALRLQLRFRGLPRGFKGDLFPHADRLIWLVLITQNMLAQLVTGPWSSWNEVAFSLYYVLLFAISAVIIHHYHCLKSSPVTDSQDLVA